MEAAAEREWKQERGQDEASEDDAGTVGHSDCCCVGGGNSNGECDGCCGVGGRGDAGGVEGAGHGRRLTCAGEGCEGTCPAVGCDEVDGVGCAGAYAYGD